MSDDLDTAMRLNFDINIRISQFEFLLHLSKWHHKATGFKNYQFCF